MVARRSLLLAAPVMGTAAALGSPLVTDVAQAAPSPKSISITGSSPAANIRALQHLLTAYGITTTADGKLGPRTKAATRTYQSRNRIRTTGNAGPLTMASMVGRSNTAVALNWKNAHTVRAAEQLLVKNRLTVPVDGRFTAADVAKMRSFQTSAHIPATGVVDHLTWSYLFQPPALQPAAPQPAGPAAVWSSSFLTAHEDGWGWSLAKMTPTQRENARFIIAVGKGYKIPERGIKLALAVAMVEGMLYNRYTATDRDSGGLFQQRPVSGWGSASQVRNKLLSTKAFFGVATHTKNRGLQSFYPGYMSKSFADAGWDVQRCAVKLKHRYSDREADANALYSRYAAGVAPFKG